MIARRGQLRDLPAQLRRRRRQGTGDGRWLPIPPGRRPLAADLSSIHPGPVLNARRGFLQWRRGDPVPRQGSRSFIGSPRDTPCFLRQYRGREPPCRFNFGKRPVEVPAGHGFEPCNAGRGTVPLPGYRAFLAGLGNSDRTSGS
jgi:hypothetical protein